MTIKINLKKEIMIHACKIPTTCKSTRSYLKNKLKQEDMGHGSYGRASESHELNFQHCQEK
jgi:hypothetical protein